MTDPVKPRDPITQSELSLRYSVPVADIRRYDQRGLLASRFVRGERRYCTAAQIRLQVVIKGQALGLSIGQIEYLLSNFYAFDVPVVASAPRAGEAKPILAFIEMLDDRPSVKAALDDLARTLALT